MGLHRLGQPIGLLRQVDERADLFARRHIVLALDVTDTRNHLLHQRERRRCFIVGFGGVGGGPGGDDTRLAVRTGAQPVPQRLGDERHKRM